MTRLLVARQQLHKPAVSRCVLRIPALLGLLGLMAGLLGCHWRSLPDSEATGKPQSPTTPPTKTNNSSDAVPTQDSETTGKPQSPPSPPTQSGYSLEDQRTLLRLARSALNHAVREGKLQDVPAKLPGQLLVKKGCFVTLTVAGQLRGCIGNIFAERPLAEAVIHNARSAALEDSRFSPVTVDELKSILVEVSVLSIPEPLEFSSPEDLLNKLHPHRDGVVLSVGLRRATFLPQVWEQLPDTREFLEHLATKAGLSADAWRRPNLNILIYHAFAFKESEPGVTQ